VTQYETGSAYDIGSVSGSTTDQVEDKAVEAKDRVQAAAGQARWRLRDQMDSRATQAGYRIQAIAQDIRSVAEELQRQGKDTPARLAEQSAERVEQLGVYLLDTDADRILRDVEDAIRKNPWAAAACGLALGFVAARSVRAFGPRLPGRKPLDPDQPDRSATPPERPDQDPTTPPERPDQDPKVTPSHDQESQEVVLGEESAAGSHPADFRRNL
jgi:hypothetical protein